MRVSVLAPTDFRPDRMEHVRVQRSERALVDVIDSLHASAYGEVEWSDVLEQLRDFLGASALCIARHAPDLDEIDGMGTCTDPAFHLKYVTEFQGQNLVWNAAAALPAQTLYHEATLFGRTALRQTRFWNEWMAPQDMIWSIGAKIAEAERGSWLIGVQGGGRAEDFDKVDMEALDLVLPTLRRVISIRERMGVISAGPDLSRAALDQLAIGVLIVDREGSILSANAAGDEQIRTPGAGLRRTARGLRARDPAMQRTLLRLLDAACRDQARGAGAGGYLIAHSEQGEGGDVAVHVGPLPMSVAREHDNAPLAIILIRSLAHTAIAENSLESLFGLTPAEARIAAALALGRSVSAIAEDQGCAINTVRNHLARIFGKTGARQQSELVSLLHQAALPTRGDPPFRDRQPTERAFSSSV